MKSQQWVAALCQEDKELSNTRDVNSPLGLADTKKENKTRMSQEKTTDKLNNAVKQTMAP